MFPLTTENIRAYIKEGITYEETIVSVCDESFDVLDAALGTGLLQENQEMF